MTITIAYVWWVAGIWTAMDVAKLWWTRGKSLHEFSSMVATQVVFAATLTLIAWMQW